MASSLQKGIQAAKAGRMQEALDFMKDAIIEEPQNADVWVWIAAIIDDLDKQEIFLKKALEIDPDSIPAQRGLSYLYKRKRDETSIRGDRLSDHTRPISPFPGSQPSINSAERSGWSKLDMNNMDEIAKGENEIKNQKSKGGGFFHNLPKLNPLESILLVVVVIVFCFIGLLAASALFDFDLPLNFLTSNKPSLAAEPPYPGVFLYENSIYFDIQQHEGLPKRLDGLPSSSEEKPLIVIWQSLADMDEVRLVYQTGEVIPFSTYQGKNDAKLVQPLSILNSGLYCLQQPLDEKNSYYWCFNVTDLPSE
jgi:tetratricopeptide (TPR) repeat protein